MSRSIKQEASELIGFYEARGWDWTSALAVEVAGIVAAAITGLQAAEAGADPADLPIPPPVE